MQDLGTVLCLEHERIYRLNELMPTETTLLGYRLQFTISVNTPLRQGFY